MIKKILTENTELLLNIDISIDAIGKDHDEIRGFPGNYDLLKKTYLLLNNLSKKNSNLTLRSSTVLSKFNQTKIKELYSHIKSQFEFDMPTISLVRGNPRDKQSLKVEKINYLHLINYIKKDIKKNPPKSLINKILMSLKTLGWDIIANVLVRENFCIPCKSGKKMFVIDHKGVLFPCEILHRSFGSFRAYNYDLDKLLQTEKARKIKNFIESRKCKCTFECAIQNSIVDYSPYYYIILKKLLLRNY